jgi:hypothetical protein
MHATGHAEWIIQEIKRNSALVFLLLSDGTKNNKFKEI